MSSVLRILALVILVACISGCSSVQKVTVRTNSDYKKVWDACIDSVVDVRFSVSFTDTPSGLIVADQPVPAHRGAVAHLNIRLFKALTSTDVLVTLNPPAGTYGWDAVERYVAALKQRIPDLEPVIVK